MADITMCDNQECDARAKCYRATAEPSAWQSWAIFEPREAGGCEHFIERVPHTREADKSEDF